MWTFDHVTGATLCYETVALLAAVTSRVRIGRLVLANGLRRVETLAADLATVDALSGGRLEVGLGVASGFAGRDYAALGLTVPSWDERLVAYWEAVDRLTEFTSPGSPLAAKPVQSPVPLILGGASESVRQLAIEHGLAWNLSADSAEQFAGLAEGQPDPQAQVFLPHVRSVAGTVAQYREARATRLVFVMVPPIEPGAICNLARDAGIYG